MNHREIIQILFFMGLSYSSTLGYGSESEGRKVGPQLAVTAFQSERGFQISDHSLKFLGVNFIPLKATAVQSIPRSSLVYIKDLVGVYIKRGGWIAFAPVRILKEQNSNITIQFKDLEEQDQVAVSGTHFLRMTEANLSAGSTEEDDEK